MITQITEITVKTANQGWLEMWFLAAGLFFIGKLVVLQVPSTLATGEKAGFMLLWPGMDVGGFALPATTVLPGLVRHGAVNLVLGTALTWGVARLVPDAFAATWLCMIGFIWLLHGGVFTLLTAFWRSRGRDVRPLMNAPLRMVSLADFWGRRWNRGFRDLVHATLFKPFTRWFGGGVATWFVFLVSGLIHELVITVPARGGYGGPTLYFLLQAIGLSLERRCICKRHGLVWRVRALIFVIAPLPLCFPPVFVERVAAPFFTFIGAL